MQNTLWLLAATFCVAAALPARAQLQDCTLDGAPVNLDHGATTRGKSGLVRCVDRQSRELLREFTLQDGRSVGLQRYYRRGRLASEATVNERNAREGRAREWNAQGVLVKDGQYADGRAIGVHRKWHDDGTLESLEYYSGDKSTRSGAQARMEFNRAGQLSGLRCDTEARLERDAGPCGHRGPSTTELHGQGGGVAERVTYDAGRLKQHETFWENGKPRASAALVGNGQTQQREYSREGALRLERVVEGGRPVSEKQYGERETLVVERRYTEGRLQSETQWYLNGQKKRVLTPEDTKTHLEQHFHDNGKLAFEGRFRIESSGCTACRPLDVHRSFDAQGQLRREVHHDDKGRRNRERTWNEAGQLLRDDELFEDGSRKANAR